MNHIICQHGSCMRDDAHPQFTKALSTITKDARTRQPKWFCSDHRGRYADVSAIDGTKKISVVKSYEIVDGQVKPLGVKDQYDRYWADKLSKPKLRLVR